MSISPPGTTGNNDLDRLIGGALFMEDITPETLVEYWQEHEPIIGAMTLMFALCGSDDQKSITNFSYRVQSRMSHDNLEVRSVIDTLSGNTAFYDDCPGIEEAIEADPVSIELRRLRTTQDHFARTMRLRRSLIALARLTKSEGAEVKY